MSLLDIIRLVTNQLRIIGVLLILIITQWFLWDACTFDSNYFLLLFQMLPTYKRIGSKKIVYRKRNEGVKFILYLRFFFLFLKAKWFFIPFSVNLLFWHVLVYVGTVDLFQDSNTQPNIWNRKQKQQKY